MRNVLFFLILWLSLPFVAVAQTDDRDTLTAFLEDNLSSDDRKVTVTGFRGAFSSRAEIDELSVADSEGVWITLSGVVLDWSRAALLRGVIDIAELTAEEVSIIRAPIAATTAASPEAVEFSLPELPVSVSIEKLEAKRILLGASLLGQAVEASLSAKIVLDGGEGSIDLRALRLGEGPQGHVKLATTYSNATKRLELDLDAAEAAGGIAASLLKVPGVPDTALKIQGAGPLDDFAAAVLLQTEGKTRLEGDVILRGAEDEAQKFSADLAGDIAPLFLPEYAAFFGPDVRFRAEGLRQKQGQLDLSALTIDTRALTLDGAALIAADGLPERLNLTGRLGLPDGAPLLLPLSGAIETRVSSADLRFSFDAAKGDGWSGGLSVTGLDRADVALDRVSLKGSGRINRRLGLADGPVLGATLEFEALGLLPGDPGLAEALGTDLKGKSILTWQPAGDGLRIATLALNGAGYDLALAGTVGELAKGFPIQGKLSARYDGLVRLSALAGRPLSGSASFTAAGEGNPLGGAFDLEAEINGQSIEIGQTELDALLRGETAISLSAKRDVTGTRLRRLELSARQLLISVDGVISSAESDLRAKLGFTDLTVLGPGYRGSLRADARFKGTALTGQLQLDGIGQSLQIGQMQADAALGGESKLALDVAFKDGQYDVKTFTIANPQVKASVAGVYAQSGSDIRADLALADLSPFGAGYRGGLQAQVQASGTLTDGRVVLSGLGQNLALGQKEADTLLAGDSQVTATLNIKGKRLEIEAAEVRNPQVSLSLSGSVTDALRKVTLEGRLVNLALLVPDFPGGLQLSGSAIEDADGFALDLVGQGPGGVDAKVAGRLDKTLRKGDLSISGVAQAALANAFLGNRQISGQTQFDLRLNGPLALSALSGQVALSGGRLSDPGLPLGLQNIVATARLGNNSVQLDLTSEATSGGRITANGQIGLSGQIEADLTLGLAALQLRNPDLFKTVLDGKVTVKGPLKGGAFIAGDISVGETELRVPSSGLGGSGAIPDLQHVNEPSAVRQTRARAGLLGSDGDASGSTARARPFSLEVKINAPSRVFLRGRGLDAELGGRLTLRGTTDNIIPSGAISLIRGRLDILGKRLDLAEAKLEMQGEMIPYLTVLASNDGDGVTSFVEITGRADDPQVRFYSSPDLPQGEVLAQLLFGRDLTKISALQAVQLASAVATLAGKGGDGIVGNLRKSFGLDDLDVSTDASGNSAVKAGKYISKRIYSEVEVDQNGQSKINLNLDLTKSTKLRGSVGSDGQTGIGVFVERDY